MPNANDELSNRFDGLKHKYEINSWRNGLVILKEQKGPATDVVSMLEEFYIYKNQIIEPGGSKTDIVSKIEGRLRFLGWRAMCSSPDSENKSIFPQVFTIDFAKHGIGFKFLWHSKSYSFDETLIAYRALYEQGKIKAGVFLTI